MVIYSGIQTSDKIEMHVLIGAISPQATSHGTSELCTCKPDRQHGVKTSLHLDFQEPGDLYMARHPTSHRKWQTTLLSETILLLFVFFFSFPNLILRTLDLLSNCQPSSVPDRSHLDK